MSSVLPISGMPGTCGGSLSTAVSGVAIDNPRGVSGWTGFARIIYETAGTGLRRGAGAYGGWIDRATCISQHGIPPRLALAQGDRVERSAPIDAMSNDVSERQRDAACAAVSAAPPGGERGVHAGHRIADRVATEDRFAGRVPHHCRETRGHPGVVAERDPVALGRGAPVPGQTDPGERASVRAEFRRVDAELLERPWPRGLDDDIRPCEQPSKLIAPAHRVEIEHEGRLASVQEIEERLVARARAILSPRAFDLHDPCTQQSKQLRAERPGPERREIHDQRPCAQAEWC